MCIRDRCVNIVDRTSAAQLIDKAQEADIPMIFFNREPVAEDLYRWNRVYYVGAKAEESGVLQGQILLDRWLNREQPMDKNGDGILQYVLLEGEPGHQDAMLRTEYAVKMCIRDRLTEERRATGIFGIRDIKENTVISSLKDYLMGGFYLNDKKMKDNTDWAIQAMHIKTPGQHTQICLLYTSSAGPGHGPGQDRQRQPDRGRGAGGR